MPEFFCEELTEMTPQDLQEYLGRQSLHGWKLHAVFRLERGNYEVILFREKIDEVMKRLAAAEYERGRAKQEWSELPWWKKMMRRL